MSAPMITAGLTAWYRTRLCFMRGLHQAAKEGCVKY